MGLFDFFKNKAATNLSSEQVQSALLQFIGGGLVVPEDNAKSYITNGYNLNVVVHSAVRYITRRAAGIPLKLVLQGKDGKETNIDKHPILDLLRRPNDFQNYNEFAEQSLGFYLLTGNSYNYQVKSTTRESAIPIELYNLPAQYVEIKTKGNTGTEGIEAYNLRTISTQEFDPKLIIHLKTPNYLFENGQWLYGMSPLKAALKALNTNNSNQTALAKLAQNLGAIGLLMFDQKSNDNAAAPNKEQLRAMQSFINKSVQGSVNRGGIRAMSQLFKWQSISASQKDLGLLEGSKMTARDIYSIYGLDSKLFNDHTSSTYNNIAEAKKGAYTEAILPTLNAWLAKLNAEFFTKGDGLCLKPDLSGIEVLHKDQTELINVLKDAYFIPTSKKQELVGIEPDFSLPEYLIPISLTDPDAIPIEEETQKRLAKIIHGYKEK